MRDIRRLIAASPPPEAKSKPAPTSVEVPKPRHAAISKVPEASIRVDRRNVAVLASGGAAMDDGGVPQLPSAKPATKAIAEAVAAGKLTAASAGVRVALSLPSYMLYVDARCSVPRQDVSLEGWPITDADVAALAATHGGVMRSLSLAGCTKLTDAGLAALQGCKKLESLVLSYNPGVTPGVLAGLRAHLGHLTHLDLTACAEAVTDETMKDIAHNCRKLTHVTVAHCTRLTDVGVKALAERSRLHAGIEAVDLTGCELVGSAGVLALLTTSHALKSLRLAGTGVTDSAFAGTNCPTLELLDVSQLMAKRFTDSGLRWAVDGTPRLQRLIMRNCQGITDNGMISLVERVWGTLLVLDIRRCLGIKGSWMAAARRVLGRDPDYAEVSAYLHGSDSKSGGDGDVPPAKAAARASAAAMGVKYGRDGVAVPGVGLVALYLDDIHEHDDRSLTHLPAVAPNLLMLSMRGCHRITNPTLIEMVSGLRSLAVLLLTRNTRSSQSERMGAKLGEPFGRAIGTNCPRFAALLAAGRQGLTDKAIQLIVGDFDDSDKRVGGLIVGSKLPQPSSGPVAPPTLSCLRTLNVCGITAISDTSLMSIAARCPDLRCLAVAGVKRISDVGIAAVASRCPQLRYLAIRSAGGEGTAAKYLRDVPAVPGVTLSTQCITDASLLYLGSCCPLLVDLDCSISSVACGSLVSALEKQKISAFAARHFPVPVTSPLIGDYGLSALTAGCVALRYLDISNQPFVSDEGLRLMQGGTPVLTTLRVIGCEGVTPMGLAALAAVLPLAQPSDRYYGLQPRVYAIGPSTPAAARVAIGAGGSGASGYLDDGFSLREDIATLPSVRDLITLIDAENAEAREEDWQDRVAADRAERAARLAKVLGRAPAHFESARRQQQQEQEEAEAAAAEAEAAAAAAAKDEADGALESKEGEQKSAADEGAAASAAATTAAVPARVATTGRKPGTAQSAASASASGAAVSLSAALSSPLRASVGHKVSRAGLLASAAVLGTSTSAQSAAAAAASTAPAQPGGLKARRLLIRHGLESTMSGSVVSLVGDMAREVLASHRRTVAALIIQSIWRMYFCRKAYLIYRAEVRKRRNLALVRARTILHRSVRAFIRRRKFLNKYRHKQAAARKIEAAYKSYRARKMLAALPWLIARWQGAARSVQRLFRSRKMRKLGRMMHWHMRVGRVGPAIAVCYRKRKAVALMARVIRGWVVRRRVRVMAQEMHDAVTAMQRIWRGKHGRHFAHFMREQRTAAAIALQRRWRGFQGRRRAWQRRREVCARDEAARVIQRIYRGGSAKEYVKSLKATMKREAMEAAAAAARAAEAASEERQRLEWAARLVQRVYLGHRGRALARLRRQGLYAVIKQNQSARKIQKAFRYHLIRKRIKARKMNLIVWMRRKHLVEDKLAWRHRLMMAGAAAMIQRWYRRVRRWPLSTLRIQAWWRMLRTRRWFLKWRVARVTCVLRIQRAFRRSIRLRYWRMLVAAARAQEAARVYALQNASAALIQYRYRAWKKSIERAAMADAEVFLMRQLGGLRALSVALEAAALEDQKERAANAAIRAARAKAQRLAARRRAALAARLPFGLGNKILAAAARIAGHTPEEIAAQLDVPTPEEAEHTGMLYNIQKQQRRTVPLEGVCGVAITVGEAETDAFQKTQDVAKLHGRPVYVRIGRDLSAPLGYGADRLGKPDPLSALTALEQHQAARAAAALEGGPSLGSAESREGEDAVSGGDEEEEEEEDEEGGGQMLSTKKFTNTALQALQRSRQAAAEQRAALAAEAAVAEASYAATREKLVRELQLAGLAEEHIRSRIVAWEKRHRERRSTMPKQVYLWVQIAAHRNTLTELGLRVYPANYSRAKKTAEWRREKDAGTLIFRHAGEATELEFRGRRDGPRIIVDLRVAPRVPGSSDTSALEEAGYECLGIDLGEVGLATGLQVWVKYIGVEKDPLSVAGDVEIKQREYYTTRLQQVIDLLQLTPEAVDVMFRAFCKVDTDLDGVITMHEQLNKLDLPDSPFFYYSLDFVEVAQGANNADRRMNFGEWAHWVTTMCLLERPEQVRFTYSYADRGHLMALGEKDIISLARVLLDAVPGVGSMATIIHAIAALPRDQMGLITVDVFGQLTKTAPVLLFPLARLQERLQAAVFGPDWWARKKERFLHARRDMQRARDMAIMARESTKASQILTDRAAAEKKRDAERRGLVPAAAAGRDGGSSTGAVSTDVRDPLYSSAGTLVPQPAASAGTDSGMRTELDTTEAMYVEMLCRRSKFVAAAYVQSVRRHGVTLGTIALLVADRDGVMKWAKQHTAIVGPDADDLEGLCLNRAFRAVALADVQACCTAADLPPPFHPRAIHLITEPFTVENGLLLQANELVSRRLDPVTGVPLVSAQDAPLLDRQRIQTKYGRILSLLTDAAAEAGPPKAQAASLLGGMVALVEAPLRRMGIHKATGGAGAH